MNKILKALVWILLAGMCGCVHETENKNTVNKDKPVKVTKEGAQDESIFDSIDSKEILEKLFDAPKIDTNGMAVWKPNYYERMKFPVSYDFNCHTKVDTIMYFEDCQKRACAAVLLATYKYHVDYWDTTKICQGDIHFAGVPIGIALFSKTKNNEWELYKFEKAFTTLGYFGTYKTGRDDAGKIGLKKVGDAWTCLSLIQGIGGNMGELDGTESLYSIEEFHLKGFPNPVLSEILSYNYHYEYTSPDEKTKERTDIKMNIIQKKKNYYDIELKSTSNGKRTCDTLIYSEDYDRYIQK